MLFNIPRRIIEKITGRQRPQSLHQALERRLKQLFGRRTRCTLLANNHPDVFILYGVYSRTCVHKMEYRPDGLYVVLRSQYECIQVLITGPRLKRVERWFKKKIGMESPEHPIPGTPAYAIHILKNTALLAAWGACICISIPGWAISVMRDKGR